MQGHHVRIIGTESIHICNGTGHTIAIMNLADLYIIDDGTEWEAAREIIIKKANIMALALDKESHEE